MNHQYLFFFPKALFFFKVWTWVSELVDIGSTCPLRAALQQIDSHGADNVQTKKSLWIMLLVSCWPAEEERQSQMISIKVLSNSYNYSPGETDSCFKCNSEI